MNDAMFIEFAEAIGCNVVLAENDKRSPRETVSGNIWSRSPTSEEVRMIVQFVATEQKRILAGESTPEILSTDKREARQSLRDATPERKSELMAWILAARAIMNTDEAVVKP